MTLSCCMISSLQDKEDTEEQHDRRNENTTGKSIIKKAILWPVKNG